MSMCPACAQIVSPETKRCPACGNDLRVRRLAHVPPDHDAQQDAELLLTAAIADVGTHRPPPPLIPPLEARLATTPPRSDHPWDGPLDGGAGEVGDLLPAGTLGRRRFLRRR